MLAPHLEASKQNAELKLLQLISQARNLDHLAFDVRLPLEEGLGDLPMPHNFPARPTRFHLGSLFDASAVAQRHEAQLLSSWMAELCSAVEHFDAAKTSIDGSFWREWAWQLLLSRAHAIQSFRIILFKTVEDNICSRSPIDFPRLLEAELKPENYGAPIPLINQLWIETPTLKRLCTTATLA